jgi:hypothetical protein
MNDWRSSYDCQLCALSAVIMYGEGSADSEAGSSSPASDVEEEEDDDGNDDGSEDSENRSRSSVTSPSRMMSSWDDDEEIMLDTRIRGCYSVLFDVTATGLGCTVVRAAAASRQQ